MDGKCWICGKEADSSEHIIKKSDIKLLRGPGPYTGENTLIHYKEDNKRIIQGPDSDIIKYEKNLCHNCNTNVSQPFDKAYEIFILWAKSNAEKILKYRMINFREVYGKDFEKGQRDLFKYYTKSLGCRINDIPRSVPLDLRDLLFQDQFSTALRITFTANEFLLGIPPVGNNYLGKSGLIANQNPNAELQFYVWSETIMWLDINYWYNFFPHGGMGVPWIANSQYIYLGSHTAEIDNELYEVYRSMGGEF